MFDLIPLPYPEDALEPFLSARQVRLHYEGHHAGYVEEVNALIAGTPLEAAPLGGVLAKAQQMEMAPLFHAAAQIANHNLYWWSMSPSQEAAPKGRLGAAIRATYGGIVGLRTAMAEAAHRCFGSGWVWLVASPDGKVRVHSLTDTQIVATSPTKAGVLSTSNANFPSHALLTMDVWEHAFYVDYPVGKSQYVDVFLRELANWRTAEERYEEIFG